MAEGQDCTPGQEERVINLLLDEYRTLREEIVGKVNSSVNLLAYGAGALALILGFGSIVKAVMAFGFLGILGLYFYVGQIKGVLSLSRHLVEIEKRINRLARAGYGCEDVLSWETKMQKDPSFFHPIYAIIRRRNS